MTLPVGGRENHRNIVRVWYSFLVLGTEIRNPDPNLYPQFYVGGMNGIYGMKSLQSVGKYPPKTNSLHLKHWGWKMSFLLGMA